VTAAQILAFRRRVGGLDARLPAGSLREAAWAGVQDSMPRAAVLSLHARVEGVGPDVLDDPALAQVWGPRYHVYVVGREDVAIFTLGRLPESGKIRERALELAVRLEQLLGKEAMRYDDAGVELGVHGNMLRYAALTGRFAIRWEGARRPTIWTVPPPQIDEVEARRELARRYVHVFGPATADGFARWGSIAARTAARTFEELRDELIPVGDAWLLASDEAALREPPAAPAPVRLLPSGDAYTLGVTPAERALLVPDAKRRAELWTPRVWPGALLVDGKVAGTWRRAGRKLAIRTWRRVPREAVVAEAESLPLPDAGRTIVEWS
jgi:hypothetical protein